MRLAESLAFNRATGDAAGKDSASARPGAADGAFDLDRLDPRDRGRDHGRPWLHSIAGINLLSSRNKKTYIFIFNLNSFSIKKIS